MSEVGWKEKVDEVMNAPLEDEVELVHTKSKAYWRPPAVLVGEKVEGGVEDDKFGSMLQKLRS